MSEIERKKGSEFDLIKMKQDSHYIAEFGNFYEPLSKKYKREIQKYSLMDKFIQIRTNSIPIETKISVKEAIQGQIPKGSTLLDDFRNFKEIYNKKEQEIHEVHKKNFRD